jgi:hypothetical protein
VPDKRHHRGPHPEDARLFGPAAAGTLRAAAGDLCWLLSRGYPHDSSLALVGNRYELEARQRTALSRVCCSDAELARRRSCQVGAARLSGARLWVDGYNVLTTVEAALAGGALFAARDGTYRDMASMHGSYRKVAETLPALDLLGQTIAALGVAECRWLLDQPVSNSGRLKGIIQQRATAGGWPWRAELVPDPDLLLAKPESGVVVATADSAILDNRPVWFNLAREAVTRHAPTAWVVEICE